MDPMTGVMLNPDMELYKLAGASDIPEIIVRAYEPDEVKARGVIGVGEPPTISTAAAIGNAVTNAIGVRVAGLADVTPERPQRPGRGLQRREGVSIMKAFEYAGPASVDDAVKLLGGSDSAEALSGGTDLISRMKDYVTSPKRVVYLKDIKELAGIKSVGKGLMIGAGTTLADIVDDKAIKRNTPHSGRRPSKSARRRSATWPPSAATCSSARGAGTSGRVTACSA